MTQLIALDSERDSIYEFEQDRIWYDLSLSLFYFLVRRKLPWSEMRGYIGIEKTNNKPNKRETESTTLEEWASIQKKSNQNHNYKHVVCSVLKNGSLLNPLTTQQLFFWKGEFGSCPRTFLFFFFNDNPTFYWEKWSTGREKMPTKGKSFN